MPADGIRPTTKRPARRTELQVLDATERTREVGRLDPRPPFDDYQASSASDQAERARLREFRRLGLAGVALRPAWYHVAYALRYHFRFADPERQRRFEAMARDLAETPLRQLTLAVAEGRALRNGEPYSWEATEMVSWLDEPPKRESTAPSEEHFSLRAL